MLEKNPLFIIALPVIRYFFLTCLIVLGACTNENTSSSQPKSVILMIGDGMGFGQIHAARLQARSENQPFILDEFPIIGLMNVESADSLITDSAASATAISTGVRTINGRIAQDSEGKQLTTLLEHCKAAGKKTGLLATSSITHATPAAFASHVLHRSDQTEIARQLVENGTVDLLLGGGYGYFIPQDQPNSFRSDQLDLIASARQKGYQVLQTRTELINASSAKLLGLFAHKGLEMRAEEPSLTEMTTAALKQLADHPMGYCLLIEGSQIDWAGHHNETLETIHQTRLFEEAVRTAYEFISESDNTLLLATSDHETGGMTIIGGDQNGTNLDISWSTKKHTAIDVPLYATGNGAERFSGSYPNTEIAIKIHELLHLPPK